MELNNIKRVYLVGIGGIGMSGLARYFHHLGCVVCGYDKTSTDLTNDLHNEGIQIIFDDRPDWIPYAFQTPDEGTLIIYTPAIPKDSAILNFFKNNGFELFKRSQVLGIISKSMFTVAVAGTHGKTTTSTMVAHILTDSGKDCSAFLGGLSTNYHSNVLYGKNNIVVVEADEYDRSFLTLYPDVAIITSMDADHLDIYGDHAHLTDSFKMFASQIKPGGTLIHKKGLALDSGFTYAVEAEADATASNIRIENGDFYFDFKNSQSSITNIKMGIAGTHNIENAVAAIEACLILEVSPDAIKSALESFRGVHRRFEYVIKNDHQIFIDDYAHHPEELKAAIKSVKRLYPGKKLTTIFQPHLYTRTRDFADGFAEALDLSDELIILDIYPARELPIEGVNADMILERMKLENKRRISKQDVLAVIKEEKPELLLTVGAGDIDTLVQPLKHILENV
ncbi:UDP-N-acetylmuramate--L-alanine ligase [Mucilaginibacter sp. BJC16-A38]|uniref:UDP-N-acetylmuramate--L-alanine ligase n=1 Tax=Mucilaginibacter phenanthrenivorans TaxID=1234842 RepID=UPI002157B421|nr:UDP-N-acetylmuramate--L-alanine ligase [Mucilaginibacter phenanthrenivorans]MCR8557949.1 UDP-N-acetylmuramate--L-alanine ligase [Mucilaginibacter phenanthrenivorans]